MSTLLDKDVKEKQQYKCKNCENEFIKFMDYINHKKKCTLQQNNIIFCKYIHLLKNII